jgi:hypothetical protein
MSREYKHYELRPVRTEFSAPGMSGLAMFVDAHGQGELYMVAFSRTFVEAAGKALPRGVSKQDPGFIHIRQAEDGTCKVFVAYIFEAKAELMWETDSKPTWLKYRSWEKKDAHTSTTQQTSNVASARESHASASESKRRTRPTRAYPQ